MVLAECFLWCNPYILFFMQNSNYSILLFSLFCTVRFAVMMPIFLSIRPVTLMWWSYQRQPPPKWAVLVHMTWSPELKRLQTQPQSWIRHLPNTKQRCPCGNKETKGYSSEEQIMVICVLAVMKTNQTKNKPTEYIFRVSIQCDRV